MLEPSTSPHGAPYIRNPFGSTYLPTVVHITTNSSNETQSLQGNAHASSSPHILNPFKDKELSSHWTTRSQIPSTENSINPLKTSDHSSLPNYDSTRYSLGRDKLAFTVFEKCTTIREKTKELANLTFLQNELQSRHQTKKDEFEKRNYIALEELRRNEVRMAAITSMEEESKEIASRISYLKEAKKRLGEDIHQRQEKKMERQKQINNIIKENYGKIDQIKHEIAIKDARKKTLQMELHNKTASIEAPAAAIELSNASQLLSKKIITNQSRRNMFSKEKNQLNEKNSTLSESKRTITSSIESLRKIKALNERLKLLTNNFKDRIALSQAGRISKIGELKGNRTSNSILEASIDNLSSSVMNAKTVLDSNQATMTRYLESMSQLADSLICGYKDPALPENSEIWKGAFAKFCESRRKCPHLDPNVELLECESNNKVDCGTEKCTFDAKSGLNLVLGLDCQTNETKDHMNDASIFHTESIWVFQEPKSEIFEQRQYPVESSDLDFLKDCKQTIETTNYPLPDDGMEHLRTPSRKRFYPRPSSELPYDASVALFDWDSVLPPSPHDKPSPGMTLSMDFLRD